MKGILPLLALGAMVIVAIVALSPHTKTSAKTAAKPVVQQPGTYVQMAREDAIQAGIDPNIFERQIQQESGFQPNVISPAGAIGIAQFMPSTAQGLGVNPYDPAQSLRGAARLMARYVQTYSAVNWANRYALALAAYNGGSGRVQYCLSFSDWYHCLYSETRAYIKIILGGQV